MAESDRTLVDISGEVGERLKELAKKEDSSASRMARVLLTEAMDKLEDRRAVSFQTALYSLREFKTLELARIIESAVKLILQRMTGTNPATEFMRGWNMEKLVKASGIPSERLQEIRDGSPPTASEATGLMRAGMNSEDLKPKTNRERQPNGK